MPITPVRTKGVDEFDQAIKQAESYKAQSIIVLVHKNTTDKDNKAESYEISLLDEDTQQKKELDAEQILETLTQKIEHRFESMQPISEENGNLGLIQQTQYKHQGDMLRLETKAELVAIQHEREIEKLKDRLDKEKNKVIDNAELIEELEEEIDELEQKLEETEQNRISLSGEFLSKVGGYIFKKNAKVIEQLSGIPMGNIASGQPTPGGTTIVEEDSNPQLEIAITEIRQMLSTLSQDQIIQFVTILNVIKDDADVLTEIMNFPTN